MRSLRCNRSGMSPDLLTPGGRRPRRWPLWIAGLAAVAAAVVVAVVALGDDSAPTQSVRVHSTPQPAPAPKPKPVTIPPKPAEGGDWPLYGNGPGRTRHMADVNLKPPFRRAWSLNGGKLIEFQPVLAGGRLFVLKNDGRALALSADTGRIRWHKRIGGLAASAPGAGGASVYFAVNHGGYGCIAGSGPAKGVARHRRTGGGGGAQRLAPALRLRSVAAGRRRARLPGLTGRHRLCALGEERTHPLALPGGRSREGRS